ncbi:Uncharacterised protein [Chlamydia abortus]|nr:Uncharacterised protein [Chlamydia abortus]
MGERKYLISEGLTIESLLFTTIRLPSLKSSHQKCFVRLGVNNRLLGKQLLQMSAASIQIGHLRPI